MNPRWNAHAPIHLWIGVSLIGAVLGCGGGLERGAPIPDPGEIAEVAVKASGATRPARVVFEWEYADARGNLRGEGSGRVNPPDRFRLDLFSTAQGSLRAVLTDDVLDAAGDLENIELPAPPFLYAMTGVFRPGPERPTEGFRSGNFEVLGYPLEDGAMRYFYLRNDRLQRVEERQSKRVRRRIEVSWGEDPAWPREAVYRNDVTPSRVRWELMRVIPRDRPFPEEIYDLASSR